MSIEGKGGKIRLKGVINVGVALKGDAGPSIRIEMVYLPTASSNRRLTRTRRGFGHVVLRHDVRNWMDQLAWTARTYAIASELAFHLPLLVTFQLVFPSRQHLPDVHNFHKAVCDALQDGLGINDQHMLTRDLEEEIESGSVKKLVIVIGEAAPAKRPV